MALHFAYASRKRTQVMEHLGAVGVEQQNGQVSVGQRAEEGEGAGVPRPGEVAALVGRPGHEDRNTEPRRQRGDDVGAKRRLRPPVRSGLIYYGHAVFRGQRT